MMKLIKLELRKNNLTPYLLAVLGIFFATLFMGMFLSIIHILQPNDANAQILANIEMLIPMVTIISMNSFAILGAVMYSKFVIEEYTGRKNVLLFTYPQKRSSILFAKFFFVFLFTFIFMLIANTLCVSIIIFIGNLFGFISSSVYTLSHIFLLSALFSLIANLVSMVSLRIGFWKKSIIWTIVTSVILVSPFGNAVALLKDNLLMVIIPVSVALLVICTFLFLGLLKKVNRMECI